MISRFTELYICWMTGLAVGFAAIMIGVRQRRARARVRTRLKTRLNPQSLAVSPEPDPGPRRTRRTLAQAIHRLATRSVSRDAALRLRPHEYAEILGGFAGLAGLLGWLWIGPPGAFAGAFFAVAGLIVSTKIRMARQLAQADQALPDFLRGVAGALKAGTGLNAALASVAQETPDPLGSEFARLARRVALGLGMDQALDELVERIPSGDLALVVMAIKIQRSTGGRLAEILSHITATVVDRQRLAQEVRALTAQGRMSGWVLTVLPIFIAGMIWTLNPRYMDPLLQSPIGWAMLGGAAASVAIGTLIIQKMVRAPEL